MAARFDFATPTRVIFGRQAARDAGRLTQELGRHALVVSSGTPARYEAVRRTLDASGVATLPFAVRGEPDIAAVEQGVALARDAGCDCVVGIGGGSALDTAKAIAALVANEGALLDYLEVIGAGRPLRNPSLPCLAIPTTAGTGSEVTRNAVIASARDRVKVSLRSPSMFPRVAIVDSELTHDLPPPLTARTGLDALTQVIEPYLSSRANPMTDAICREAIPRAAAALPRAFHDGANADARDEMAFVALLSGMALTNAGLGAVHGFAAAIGGMFDAPNGAVCATLLPHVMAGNLRALQAEKDGEHAAERFGHVARMLTGRPNAAAEDGVRWIRDLVGELEIPGLASYGVSAEDVDGIIAAAARSSSMKANPIVLSEDRLRQIATAAL